MTRFLLLTLYAEERTRSYEATALGMAAHGTLVPLAHSTARPGGMGAASAELPVLQLPVLLQGYSEYELTVRSKGAERDPPPQLEFRRACAGCRSLPVSLPTSCLLHTPQADLRAGCLQQRAGAAISRLYRGRTSAVSRASRLHLASAACRRR